MNPAGSAPRVWAVVPAAGRGERFVGSSPTAPPKQYAVLLGASILEWSLRRLLAEERIAAVVAVLAPGDAHWPPVAAKLGATWAATSAGSSGATSAAIATRLLTANGGASRQESVLNGLERLAGEAAPHDWVLVHDAARPCLTPQELQSLFAALDGGAPGAVLATPIVDTIKRERDGIVAETVDRKALWRALTPQVYRYADLRRALNEAVRADLPVTDEAQAMERLGIRAALVAGSPFNIKVTRPEDLQAAARILITAEASAMRIGNGFDVHAFGPGDHVVLGGVRIAHSHGVLAHSDGDVIIHALCDAILGAIGRGDIGQHFPDTDPRYRGADSRVFLREVAAQMRAMGLQLVNADVTVLAEAPRIAKHRGAMAAALAEDLGAGVERINIKATTTERLGSIGRGEGLAAMAVVLLDR
jgi:2-C-methyl-D-erythritol 2,4-cyclodiphosphate synthase/2-C-methyl-D-erythritol 4-phosphate cytidylyltransferase